MSKRTKPIKDIYGEVIIDSKVKPIGYICLRCGAIYKTEAIRDKCGCPR